jgi:hypothetical protein
MRKRRKILTDAERHEFHARRAHLLIADVYTRGDPKLRPLMGHLLHVFRGHARLAKKP